MQQQRLRLKIFRVSCKATWLFGCLLAFALLFAGCAPQIGDACVNDGDCPTGAICDRSVDEGYCTIRNCRSGECPSESTCVRFDRHTSYCMRACESDDDCRRGHSCVEDDDAGVNYCFVAD